MGQADRAGIIPTTAMAIRPYHRGKFLQVGGGGLRHARLYTQRGRGFGSLFASVASALRPLLSSGLKAAVSGGKKALGNAAVQSALAEAGTGAIKSGVNLAGNLISGNKRAPKVLKADIKRARKKIGKALKGTTSEPVKKRAKKSRTILDD